MSKLWLPSRRSLIYGAGAAIVARPALALTPGQRAALFGGPPSWVLKGAKVDMDFANGRYYGGSLANLLSISRASQGTDLLPTSASGAAYNTFANNVLRITPGLGLLIEEARTNVLLNSTAPATQTSASLAAGTYALWSNGPGGVTPSAGTAVGSGFARASQGAPTTFTLSSPGTVVFTVDGSLNAFQCELGAFGTSLIVTAGAQGTRAKDNITIAGLANTILQTNNYSAIFKAYPNASPTGTGWAILADVGSPFDTAIFFSITPAISSFSVAHGGLNDGSVTIGAFQNYGLANSAAGRAVVRKGSGIASDANQIISSTSMALGGVGSIYISRAAFFNSALSNAALLSAVTALP